MNEPEKTQIHEALTEEPPLRPQQQLVVDNLFKEGFVAAGAGSGKTRVIESCFTEALADEDTRLDQILAITFTEKAAGEMARRIRKSLRKRGMTAERRQIQDAQISTIHGFCASLVRKYALVLGIDPEFKIMNQPEADILKKKTFDLCVERMIAAEGDPAVDIQLEADGNPRDPFFKKISAVYELLRSRGHQSPDFTIPEIDLNQKAEPLRAALRDAREAIAAGSSKVTEAARKIAELEDILSDDRRRVLPDLLRANKPRKSGKDEAVKDAIGAVQGELDRYLCWVASEDMILKMEIIRGLLRDFSAQYAETKRARGLVDFEDLQLLAWQLLDDHKQIREQVSASYRLVMVDEFQDTNPLQCRIIDAISNGNLLTVGDENQSIYGFRNADVGIFQRRYEEADRAGRLFRIEDNFRSQPGILDFIKHLFHREGMFAERYLDLRPQAKPDGRAEDRRVDVILINGTDGEETPGIDELVAAQAKVVASRLESLVKQETYQHGDIAILLRKKKRAEVYKQALDDAGIPSYLAIGFEYFQMLELGEVISMLRLLVNPLDDVALLTVLRSPMVGVTDDTLAQLRRIAGDGTYKGGPPPLWDTVFSEDERSRTSNKEDAAKLKNFADELSRIRTESRRKSLAMTVRSVTGYRDHAATVAGRKHGKKAFANLMKLHDLAADFEDSWGRDLPAFVEFLERQRQSQAEEAEAPTQSENAGAVRIVTIHSAKGLEFPVVVWASMEATMSPRKTMLLCGENGELGFRYSSLGSGGGEDYFDYAELFELVTEKALGEEKRDAYVAMTRAKSHLILTGISELDKDPKGLSDFAPIEWLRSILSLGPEELDGLGLDRSESISDPVRLSPDKDVYFSLTACFRPLAIERSNRGSETEEKLASIKLDPKISELPPPALFLPPVISPTSLDNWRHCRLRYYLDNVARLGTTITALDDSGGKANRSAEEPASPSEGNLDSRSMGTLVHAILENAPFPLPEMTPELAQEYTGGLMLLIDNISSEDMERALAIIRTFATTAVASEIAAAFAQGRISREQEFTFGLGGAVISGKMDVICSLDDRVLVIDYKTGKFNEDWSAEEAAESYQMQAAAYGVAAARLFPDMPVEVSLVFISAEQANEYRRRYDAGDVEQLEQQLMFRLNEISQGDFPCLEDFDSRYCPACTGNSGPAKICPTAARANP
jgi:ATP-dependent exoDNAse (exonuclease V) beta subunit